MGGCFGGSKVLSSLLQNFSLEPRRKNETILCRRQNSLSYSGETENGSCLNIHCQENVLYKTTLSDNFLDLNRVVISVKILNSFFFFKIEIFCGSGNQTTDQGSVK